MLHNNLGGKGGRDPDRLSLLPECAGKTQSDDCSKAMGELAPITQIPKALAPPD